MFPFLRFYVLLILCKVTILWGSQNIIIYQPQEKDFVLPQWEKHIKMLSLEGFKSIVLQWSTYGTHRFYIHHPQWLPEFLKIADTYNIDVYIGLYADPEYFDIIQKKDTNIPAYLNTLYFKNMQTAFAVSRTIKKEKAFKGWYIYDEINDVTWRDVYRQSALQHYFHRLDEGLSRLTPTKEHLVSAYFTGTTKPVDYVKTLEHTLPSSWILLLQSGVGAGLVDTKTCMQYYQVFKHEYSRKWIPIIEIFRFEKKQPVSSFETFTKQKICLKEPYAFFSWRYFFEASFYHSYHKDTYLNQ